MSKIIIITIFLCLLLAPLIVNGAKNSTKKKAKQSLSKEECTKLLLQSSDLVKPVLLIDGEKFPLTIKEIDSHCVLGQKVYKVMNMYKPCLYGLGRQALIILNKGIRKFMRSICNSKSKKESAIIDLKCATSDTLPGWSKCIKIVDRQLNWVANNSTDDALLGDMCCLYNEATECVNKNTASLPGCNAKANTTKFFTGAMDSVLKEVLDFVCGKYQHKDDCERENPVGLRKLRTIADDKTIITANKDTFLIPPVLKAVERLSSDDE